MFITRRAALGALAAAPLLVALRPQSAFAAEPMVFQSTPPVAIHGTDPVAYFTQNGPVAGLPDYTHTWNGATWQFATAANRDAFAADPDRYAPLFGGYCAFAASRGYLAPTIPEAWTVYEDRLYLNASLRARALWLAELPGVIDAGHENWPAILG
mgnify:CR=1 FL=1